MAPVMHRTILRLSVLAALDGHHKQNGRKVFAAEDLEFVKCEQMRKGWWEKQIKLFARKATENDQMP